MKSKKSKSIFPALIVLALSIGFVTKFAGPNLLKQYVSYGVGSCKSIPILCMQPEEKTFYPEIDKKYLDTLIPQTFPKMSISIPKGFAIVQELIHKRYYKRRQPNNEAVIYLLFQKPGEFIRLYPDVKRDGVTDNYEFIKRLMYADLDKIDDITKAFFIIMKSVFTPDIGNQGTAKMIKFKLTNLKGFINYTMSNTNNYFDCNVLDDKGNFFKIYIKDVGSRLDLNKIFAIISTVRPLNQADLS